MNSRGTSFLEFLASLGYTNAAYAEGALKRTDAHTYVLADAKGKQGPESRFLFGARRLMYRSEPDRNGVPRQHRDNSVQRLRCACRRGQALIAQRNLEFDQWWATANR